MIEMLEPASVKAVTTDSHLVIHDRGNGCNVTQLGMNGRGVLGSKDVRFAIASAVDKPAYVTGFYSGEASVANNWLPAGAMYYKREYLPTHNIPGALSYLAQGGVSAAGVNLDLWYPSGAPVSVLPDATGLARAIAVDLETVGFKVTLKTEAYPDYLADQANGKLTLWLQSQNCRWAAADDFLYGPFHYTNGAPSPMYNYTNDALDALMTGGMSDRDMNKVAADWQQGQDLLAADMPSVPLLSAKLPVAARDYVRGFVGAGNRTEILDSVWLDK
jgi:peptide/nickel transport system substrate-binding protein